MKSVKSSLLKILKVGCFAKHTEYPQTELKESDMKSALHMQFLGLRAPNLHLFRSMMTPDVKISKCHKIFKIWPMAKKSNSLSSW